MPSNPEPTQPLTGQPMRPEGGCSLAGPNGSRIPIEEPHSYTARKGANTIFVRTCDLCGEIDWDALHEATVERVAIEVSRLRAENTAQARQLAAAHELHRPVNHRGLRVCNACTPLDVLMQAVSGRGRRGVEYPCPTARALGVGDSGEKGYTNSCTPDDQGQSALDQSGEGQSDEG
jgi:hypothetical protein